MSNHSIQYLQRAQIDTVKWDNCLAAATNGLIYAYSFYLDRMAGNWDALVLNDYEAVMPLPWKKKWGASYIAHPPLTASLGIFGTAVTAEITNLFIGAIPARFKLVDLLLNPANFLPASRLQSIRNNYVLDLNSKYEDIYRQYRNNVRRNIKKAQQLNCRYAIGVPVEEVIRLAHWQIQQQTTNIGEEDYTHFKDLFHYLQSKQSAEACGVYTPNNELVASCAMVLFKWQGLLCAGGQPSQWQDLGASHYLIDRFIEAHADRNSVLDFEGSILPAWLFLQQLRRGK